jgi:hypothetical protein
VLIPPLQLTSFQRLLLLLLLLLAMPPQLAGGPRIPMRYGREDVLDAAQCAPEGRLPCEYL